MPSLHISYLLILFCSVMILLENRLKRVVLLLAFQGALLLIPVFREEPLSIHFWLLVSMIVVFKIGLTPFLIHWSAKRTHQAESIFPTFGYLPAMFLLFLGAIFALFIGNYYSLWEPEFQDQSFTYVLLDIYVGMVGFIVRRHWIGIIASFAIFENATFLLTLLLRSDLPIGIEFGSFLDAIFIMGTGVALRLNMKEIKNGKGVES